WKSVTSCTASRGTTQSATDSWRRPYCSCANACAKVASGAATEPACVNGAPFFSWRKTSQIKAASSRGFGEHDLPHPRFLVEHAPAQIEPLLRLRPVPGDDVLQLVP